MATPLQGSQPLYQYEQEATQCQVTERPLRNGVCNNGFRSPTRQKVDSYQKKSMMHTKSNNKIEDDLTLSYSTSPSPRAATERDPMDYTLSPASARSFRILSLDGCCEEQVSPLFPDCSCSSSLSSSRVAMIPVMPEPIVYSIDSEKDIPPIALPRGSYISKHHNATTTSNLTQQMNTVIGKQEHIIKKKGNEEASKPRRRRSTHNRSQFVFDGNLSLGSVGSPPMCNSINPSYASPTYSSPSSRMSFPPSPMMLPPNLIHSASHLAQSHSFDIESHYEQQDIRMQGRKTPPPSHKEQRKRNRAMPSVQYEKTILNQLRQQHQGPQFPQLRHQNTW